MILYLVGFARTLFENYEHDIQTCEDFGPQVSTPFTVSLYREWLSFETSATRESFISYAENVL